MSSNSRLFPSIPQNNSQIMSGIRYHIMMLLLLVVLGPSATAVRPNLMRHHELSMQFLRGGVGSMAFEGRDSWSRTTGNWAMGIGLDYTYWFSRHVGVTTGFSVDYLSHSEQLDNFSSSSRGIVNVTNGGAVVPYGATMSVVTSTVHETQSFTMLEIPVQLSLKARHLYGRLGGSLCTSLTTYGAYEYASSEYTVADIEGLGVSLSGVPLSSSNANGGSGDYYPAQVRHPFFVMIAAEIGWRFFFDQLNMVSLSIHGSYALNRCQPDVVMAEVVDVSRGSARSVAPMQAGLVSGYRYYNIGAVVTYHFGFGNPIIKKNRPGRGRKKVTPPPNPEEQPILQQ
ncbi:MAG: hypothetical protein IJ620_03175 [Bacteroidales bacterium]|nr:hypothetical protein [Bacteroidales bacterium]